ncbi:hypothetical protein OG552_10610 [Streptomyces sp. NBC_01476]|uniref:hypothetical protein n=1 Tax=Streptomyces sp. NBC_01476 TaxID=2903881 RepID=UPI002E33732D|nr:hypothetical protein [Streptomyces sp. NBC_01476]
MIPHPVSDCGDPQLLCPQHDQPFYPTRDYDQEHTMPRTTEPEPDDDGTIRTPIDEV